MSKKKKIESEEMVDIRESLDRISSSVAAIAGILDMFLQELHKEKEIDRKYHEHTTPFSEE